MGETDTLRTGVCWPRLSSISPLAFFQDLLPGEGIIVRPW
jgi:hypothetical protein